MNENDKPGATYMLYVRPTSYLEMKTKYLALGWDDRVMWGCNASQTYSAEVIMTLDNQVQKA